MASRAARPQQSIDYGTTLMEENERALNSPVSLRSRRTVGSFDYPWTLITRPAVLGCPDLGPRQRGIIFPRPRPAGLRRGPDAAEMPGDASDRPVRNRPRAPFAWARGDRMTVGVAANPEAWCCCRALRLRAWPRARDAAFPRVRGAASHEAADRDAVFRNAAFRPGENLGALAARAADRRDRSHRRGPRNRLRRAEWVVRSASRSRR